MSLNYGQHKIEKVLKGCYEICKELKKEDLKGSKLVDRQLHFTNQKVMKYYFFIHFDSQTPF